MTRSALEAIVKWLVMVLDLPVRLVDMLLAFTLRHMDGRVQDSLAAAERKRMAVLVQPCRIVDPMAPGTTTAMRFSPVVLN